MATGKPSIAPMSDATLAVLSTKVDALLEDAGERREQMTELVRAVNKLAVIEERQTADRAALERVFSTIAAMHIKIDKCDEDLGQRIDKSNEDMDKRVKRLEESDPMNKISSGLVMQVLKLGVAAVGGAVIASALRTNAPAMIQVAPAAPAQPAQTTNQPSNK